MYDQSKISELIRFARVKAGSTVIDVYPGEGEWTRLFSEVVGPEGRVYSFVPAEVAHFNNDPLGRMRTLAKEPGRENVEVVSADLVAMPKATQPADVLWLHLFYHDLHTALMQARGATAADFNRAVYKRLKPGGSYVIVDHAAAAGAGTGDSGAARAIMGGKSLLPAGVTRIEGNFARGDCVIIRNAQGGEIGRSLVAYDASEAVLIAGRNSQDIESLLGEPGRATLIHRDDMAVAGD
ncbi:PUA domain-containing protein [Methylocapsa acidiphila]|uniref:PUA domain-containing protein n=1 Tax=Methylocapsa acidiphila TaxID=133552 RepID=UPI00040585B1|nr:PUA domain-containing protein [Methylocapsa acidiphila]